MKQKVCETSREFQALAKFIDLLNSPFSVSGIMCCLSGYIEVLCSLSSYDNIIYVNKKCKPEYYRIVFLWMREVKLGEVNCLF